MKKTNLKLGSNKRGAVDTLKQLKESGMPLRQTIASGKAPSYGTGDKKRRPKGI